MITKCNDCIFWLPENVQRISSRRGICRRYPPKQISTPISYISGSGKITYIDVTVKGPTTLDDDACGEGKPKSSSVPDPSTISKVGDSLQQRPSF